MPRRKDLKIKQRAQDDGSLKLECPVCKELFVFMSKAKRHLDGHFEGRFTCSKGCGYTSVRKDNAARHERNCKGKDALKNYCFICSKQLAGKQAFYNHLKSTEHKREEYGRANIEFRQNLAKKVPKPKPGLSAQFADEDVDQPVIPEGIDEELEREIRLKWQYIRTWTHTRRRCCKYFNIKIRPGITFTDVAEEIFRLQDGRPFKMTVQGGFVLRSVTMEETEGENGEKVEMEEVKYSYYYPSSNTTMVPIRSVHDRKSLEEVIAEFENADLERAMKCAPSSHWALVGILNVMITVYPQNRYSMICGTQEEDELFDGEDGQDDADDEIIREYIRLSRSIRSLHNDGHHAGDYMDKLCVFRAVADAIWELPSHMQTLNLQDDQTHKQLTDELFRRWCRSSYPADNQPTIQTYLGTKRSELPHIEALFRIKLNVFELSVSGRDREQIDEEQDMADLIREIENDPHRARSAAYLLRTNNEIDDVEVELSDPSSTPFEEPPQVDSQGQTAPFDPRVECKIIRRSMRMEPGLPVVNALLFKAHFYRITNVQAVCRTWRCQRCNRLFNRYANCRRHQSGCTDDIKRTFPSTGFTLTKTVFQRLREAGFAIEDQFFRERIVFDFEARFEAIDAGTGMGLRFTKELIPLSVSVVSNYVEEGQDYHVAKFFCEEDPQELVRQFYDYVYEIATQIGAKKAAEFRDAIEFAKDLAKPYKALLDEYKENEDHEDSDVKKALRNKLAIAKENAITHAKLKRWVSQIPVLGYNSGKFDINLIRRYLLPIMATNRSDKMSAIIERGKDFLNISTQRLLLLDVIHYMPPGVSLDDFIRSYAPANTEGKYVFPYEFITSYGVLSQPLPGRSAFDSTLKNSRCTEEEYQRAKDLYERFGCRNLMDLLRVYNNQDVIPFLSAIDRLFDIFKEWDIDIFKMGCISLPGVAQRRMFSKQNETIVPLFSQKYSDWHNTIKQNIVGGPSIIFQRKMEVGDKIRAEDPTIQNHKICKMLAGLDANSLYLYCIGRNMPVGIPRSYVLRDEDAEEVSVHKDEGVSAEVCMARIRRNMNKLLKHEHTYYTKYEVPWVIARYREIVTQHPNRKLSICHQFNGGQKMFLSADAKKRIYVDGYIPELELALEYNGCYFHGHNCTSERGRIHFSENPQEAESDRARRFEETEWRRRELEAQGIRVETTWECDHPELRHEGMKKAIKEILPPAPDRQPTAGSLIKRVAEGKFFGVVECDVQVPWWNEDLRHQMKEFPPIFKNVSIGIDDIGDYMKEYATEKKIMSQPRRSLIGSYFGTQICLATPMLKYLLSKGLIVTRFYKALEFVADPMFKFITDEVTNLRKEADQAGSDRVVKARGNVAKLVGNSCYGKCLTNLEGHETIRLMEETLADRAINDPLFTKLDPVDDKHYLVHLRKGRVVHNLPILIAFFVYNYAKLSMTEFYYEFMLRHVGKQNFQLVEMDTDSFYFGLSEESLDAAASSPDYYRYKHLFIEGPDTVRQPGLFKLEWWGTKMIALNPKCYICINPATKNKISSKGVSHKTNALTYQNYEDVLYRRERVIEGPANKDNERPTTDAVLAINRGFMMRDGRIVQYELMKSALSHLYIKRKVMRDMISTEPSDL